MGINENMIKGKWLEIRGEVRKAWGKLTDDELDKTEGDVKAIAGLLQQRYGEAQEKYETKVSDIFKKYQSVKKEAVAETKEALRS